LLDLVSVALAGNGIFFTLLCWFDQNDLLANFRHDFVSDGGM